MSCSCTCMCMCVPAWGGDSYQKSVCVGGGGGGGGETLPCHQAFLSFSLMYIYIRGRTRRKRPGTKALQNLICHTHIWLGPVKSGGGGGRLAPPTPYVSTTCDLVAHGEIVLMFQFLCVCVCICNGLLSPCTRDSY